MLIRRIFANDTRRVILSQWYQELFPQTKLSSSKKAISDFETTKGGGRIATSIGGTLTGRGADWVIIDDPLKPADANSDIQREKVNEWYRSTLFSRLNDKKTGKIILIMQRLHENDLTGYLQDSNANFKHIKLPIIAEEDETWPIFDRIMGTHKIFKRKTNDLLHPDRENMDVIADLKNSLGEMAFAGQYQQRPAPAEGGVIKKSWINYYEKAPEKFMQIILPWDTASKTGENNAFSACIILGVSEDRKIYVLGAIRERVEFPDLVKKIEETHTNENSRYNNPDKRISVRVKTLIEEASSGIQVVQLLKKKYPRSNFSSIRPTQDKKERLINISPYIENGTILFPNTGGLWLKELMTELLTFPATKFKDQCDALSMGVECALEIVNQPEMRARWI